MLNKWAPDMVGNISGARLFNLRLHEALPVARSPQLNRPAKSLAGPLELVGPLELARGNKPNDHGPHDDYPVWVGKPLMLNEVAAQRVPQSR